MRILIYILLINTILASSSVLAAMVTINIQAEITNINISQNINTNTDFAQVGDIINGSFSYDTSEPLSGPTITNFYTLQPNTEIFGVDLNVGKIDVLKENGINYTVSMTTDFKNSNTYNGAHSVVLTTFTTTDGWPGGSGALMYLNLIDTSGSVFTDNVLPTNLDLSDFDYKEFNITDWNSGANEWGITTNITYLGITPIPLPPSILLFTSGILLLLNSRILHITMRCTGLRR